MALLYRLVKLRDAGDTRLFTFIVTRTVTRDFHRGDVTSKEFPCACHKWAISFTRAADHHALGVFLVWRSACVGLRCYVDFAFTLLNRDHFGLNEVFSAKRCRFTVDQAANGNRRWIAVADLPERAFTDDNGEFQVELAIANVSTVFESDVRVPHSLCFSGQGKATSKIESNYFLYGSFEWNVSIFPLADAPEKLLVSLNRLTGFDHQCRIRYRVVLGEGERRLDSGPVTDFSDKEGRGFGWASKAHLADLVRRGGLRVYLELLSAHPVSEIKVFPSGSTLCYDREKQTWAVEADVNGDFLRLKIVYRDAFQVALNHLRYVSWSAHVIRSHPKTGAHDSVEVLKAPLSRYYVQEAADEGVIMETDIPIDQVTDPACCFLEANDHLTIQVEWMDSMLLFQASYHKYDEVCRAQNYQMRKEMSALQAENFHLERQLVRCHKSLAYMTGRNAADGLETCPAAPVPYSEELASDTE